ncbi:MAG: acyltransferase family protein [Pseudomonadota bacterium]
MTKSYLNGRVHALDNLRACMMWLGIVLHVCVNHLSAPSFMPFKDREVSFVADSLLVFIHSFRMPVFFILAGFLAAMMVDTRGVQQMLRNRVRRIALPFAVFWPILFVATVVLVLMFRHVMNTGMIGLAMSDAPKGTPGRPILNTMHMWFIYYLFLFCMLAGLACAGEKFIPARIKQAVQRLFGVLAGNWWGFLVLAMPIAVAGIGFRAGMITPSGSFIPNLPELVHSGMFFLYGWTVYRLREQLLEQYARHCWKFVAGGLVPYAVTGYLFQLYVKDPAAIAHFDLLLAYIYGSASWLWSIALIGLFVRYLPTQNRVLRYLSDSSYWVFMVHMLGTIGFGILLYNAPLGAIAKMSVNVLLTTASCLLTYQVFVRSTWIGVLLNGKRQPRAAVLTAAPAV